MGNKTVIRTGSSTGAAGSGNIETVTQVAHGFSPGIPIYYDGNSYQQAKADARATVGRAVVVDVLDTDTFQLCKYGKAIITDATFAGAVVVGKFYLTSASVVGGIIPSDDSAIIGYVIKNTLFQVMEINGIVVTIDVLPWRSHIDTVELKYTAGLNGSVTGTLDQLILENSNGSPVTAIPDAGFVFTQWSDGITDNPRTDIGVIADIDVTATFSSGVNRGYFLGGNLPSSPVDCHVFVNGSGDMVLLGDHPQVSTTYIFTPGAGTGPTVIPHPSGEGTTSSIVSLVHTGKELYVLYDNGNLYYRGHNQYGCAGIGSVAIQSAWILSNTNVKDIQVGCNTYSYYGEVGALIIKDIGGVDTLWGAGHGSAGGLGTGSTAATQSTWTQCALPINVEPSTLVCNSSYINISAFIAKDGDVYVVGYNGNGAMGQGNTTVYSTFTKFPLPGVEKAVQVLVIQNMQTSDGSATFVLTDAGNIYGAGYALYHEFGIGLSTAQTSPVLMYNGSTTKATKIMCRPSGWCSLFYIDENGDMFATGYNSFGALGVGDTTNRNTWTQVLIPYPVSEIMLVNGVQTGAWGCTFAITNNNRLYGWGHNAEGQVGNGTTVDAHTPYDITSGVISLFNPLDITQVRTACYTSTVANILVQVNKDVNNKKGDIFGWGTNDKHQISNTAVDPQLSPVLVYTTP